MAFPPGAPFFPLSERMGEERTRGENPFDGVFPSNPFPRRPKWAVCPLWKPPHGELSASYSPRCSRAALPVRGSVLRAFWTARARRLPCFRRLLPRRGFRVRELTPRCLYAAAVPSVFGQGAHAGVSRGGKRPPLVGAGGSARGTQSKVSPLRAPLHTFRAFGKYAPGGKQRKKQNRASGENGPEKRRYDFSAGHAPAEKYRS